MKKFAIFLISATLLVCSFNLNAQTDGCTFRFVLKNPNAMGWSPEVGVKITVNDMNYGFLNLPWGTPVGEEREEIKLLPSGEIHFSWIGYFNSLLHYFEIYNSSNELIYASPEEFGNLPETFFIYQNECNIGIKNYSSAIKLYPNPANNIVNISGENISTVKVFNNLGQLINTYYNVNSINVSSYQKGIYIFNITTMEGKNKAYKILITD